MIYVLVRYSILSDSAKAWVIGRENDFISYKEMLFSPNRLRTHFELFRDVTLPSLHSAIRRSAVPVKCVVLTSESLPVDHLDNLAALEVQYSWLKVHQISSKAKYESKFEELVEADLTSQDVESVSYATVRLDDDDAVSDNFFVRISTYVDPRYQGMVVSLSRGYMVYISNGRFDKFVEVSAPKVAQGLSFICNYSRGIDNDYRTVYSLGNHTKVDENFPVLLDAASPAFLWVIHDESDLSQKNKNRVRTMEKSSELLDVLQYFSISPKMLPD